MENKTIIDALKPLQIIYNKKMNGGELTEEENKALYGYKPFEDFETFKERMDFEEVFNRRYKTIL